MDKTVKIGPTLMDKTVKNGLFWTRNEGVMDKTVKNGLFCQQRLVLCMFKVPPMNFAKCC
jgi:hypothetical protein